MASWPWVRQYERHGQDLGVFPNVRAWFVRIGERPAVKRGIAVGS